ncbi:MAG: tRNA-dihydrouridine synthase [Candidatus Cloacimonetes bacterium]|nr:tRNA-dihydrouridine synthase [Candidatus Cloacimonadota bacterium]MCF8012756.1 tRNA-dihydrouridine synthase [Candidatus Woesearchaeota archaeon]
MRIKNLELDNPFFLAPMEAVNCTSFRLLCKKRGASLVFTDMVDADIFMEKVSELGKEKAIKLLINPHPEEKPLAIQLGGANIETLKKTIAIIEPIADLIDYNIGCPLPYMLGKKGGCYLMKHPDQLYKIIKELRIAITKPFTVKMRSGWDKNSINALKIAKELEILGVDALTIHARTRVQKYQDKSDWPLVRKIKESVNIPIILSGDVTNSYLAHMAFAHTKCDFIMIGRGAKNNPSIFVDLNNYWKTKKQPIKPTNIYDKKTDMVKRDFKYFIELYERVENRNNLSELKDHTLWFARECQNNKELTQKFLLAKNKVQLHKLFNKVYFRIK